jgi:hypothetical protein
MSKYETYLEELDSITVEDQQHGEALEAATDALAFVQALHTAFSESGYDLGEEPDTSKLEQVMDIMAGELAAASLFLAEDSFENVPKMLRTIAKAFEATGKPGEEIPTVIINGYNSLAARIEATRVQTQQMKDLVAAQPTK